MYRESLHVDRLHVADFWISHAGACLLLQVRTLHMHVSGILNVTDHQFENMLSTPI